jgi:hypothetical protein
MARFGKGFPLPMPVEQLQYYFTIALNFPFTARKGYYFGKQSNTPELLAPQNA